LICSRFEVAGRFKNLRLPQREIVEELQKVRGGGLLAGDQGAYC
jgi:hypothetical protein